MRKLLVLSIVFGLMLTASPVRTSTVTAASSPVESLLALLPDSDIVGVIDMPRVSRDLLPVLKTIETAGIARLAADFEDFAASAGLDPSKASSAVVGVKLAGLKIGGGVLVAEGIDIDPKAIEKAALAKAWKFRVIDPETRPVYELERVVPPAAGTTDPPKSDSMFLASLGGKRVAAGDLNSVKAVAANASNASRTAGNLIARGGIAQNTAAGLIKFSLVIPDDIRQMLDGQGELFKQVAAVRVIFGTLDITADQSASLAARLATNSKDEALQMGTSLKSLVGLGKALLGGSDDPLMKGIAQLVDQVQIGSAESDVTLNLLVPKSLLDQLTKSK